MPFKKQNAALITIDLKCMVCRIVLGIVSVQHCLRFRGLDTEGLCPLCDCEAETIDHAFLSCNHVQMLLIGSLLGLRYMSYSATSFMLTYCISWQMRMMMLLYSSVYYIASRSIETMSFLRSCSLMSRRLFNDLHAACSS